eukprot:g277.t1
MRCLARSSEEAECGHPNKFCQGGVDFRVSPGYFSIDAAGTDRSDTRGRRTGQRVCPRGYFCQRGEKKECGDGSVYCPEGSSEPVRAPAGFYTGPQNASKKLRFIVTPCGCDEMRNESTSRKCGSFQFYCNSGRRFEVNGAYYTLRQNDAAEEDPETLGSREAAEKAAVLVDKQACDQRDICIDGVARPCPGGHACLQNQATLCQAGTVGDGGKCVVCPDKHYEVNRTRCIACPREGVACTAGLLLPKADYWYDMEALRAAGGRINENTAIYKCPINGICTMNASAGSTGLPLTQCRQGYSGTMCWDCSPGYGRSVANQCKTCPNMSLLRFAGVAIALVAIALVVFTLKHSLRPRKPGEEAPPPVATVKIFINYVYMLSLLGAVDIDWGERMKTLFATSRTASGGAISFSDCFDIDFWFIV